MSTWIRNYDILSPKIGLYFEGNKRYFTPIGLIMSFLFLFLTVAFGIYFLLQYIFDEQMYIIYSKDSKETKISGNFSNKFFGISLVDFNGRPIDPRIIEIHPVFINVDPEGASLEELELISCQSKKDKEIFENLDSLGLQCLERKNKEDINLIYYSSPYHHKYLNIYFTKCQNSTENNFNCYPDDEITEMIEENNYYTMVYAETVSIDHDKRGNPISPGLFSEQLPIVNGETSVYSYPLRKVKYISDDGKVASIKKKYEDFGFDSQLRGSKTFSDTKKFIFDDVVLGIQISLDISYIERYQRSYVKLQSIVANIGGICSFSYFACGFLTKLFCKGSIILSINQRSSENYIKLAALHLKDSYSYRAKHNNFVKGNEKLSKTQVCRIAEMTKRKKESFGCLEVIFYKCWKGRDNCKFLREYEANVKRFLDIKNLIAFWKEFENNKFETIITQKGDLSNIGFLKKSNKKLTNFSNESALSIDKNNKAIKIENI